MPEFISSIVGRKFTAMAERRNNVVLFPFMAQGHMIPFVALALQILKTTNHNVTIVNTPSNIRKLRSTLPPNSPITLLEIPFESSSHGLPPNTENTDVLPYPLVVRLLYASTTLRSSFKSLLKNLIHSQLDHLKPLCVIADIFFGWTASVAKELGIFHVIFSGASGYGLACYYSLWMNRPHRKVDADEFSLPDFPEAGRLHRTQLPTNIAEADGTDPWSIFQINMNMSDWVNSDGILFNTMEEFDRLGLSYFTRKLGLPVWAIGPVISSPGSQNRAWKSGGIKAETCQEWLDTKPLNCVIFVSFGSMNTISESQMMQLALVLEASGKDFIWVVRPPIGFDINSDFRAEDWLPQGFEERMRKSKKGLVVHNWAPQVEILSHKAVTAFISHCGWNSVVESLSHGVPILGWPLAAEQFFNCKFLEEEVGVCVEIARGNKCEIQHENVVGKIKLAMDETEKGEEMKRKACEIKQMISNATLNDTGFRGSSVRVMDDFFRTVLSTEKMTSAGSGEFVN